MSLKINSTNTREVHEDCKMVQKPQRRQPLALALQIKSLKNSEKQGNLILDIVKKIVMGFSRIKV